MSTNFIEDERELYHFHFNSSQLCEDLQEVTENTISSTIKLLEQMLLGKFPEKEEKIKSQINNLEKLFLEKAREPLRKMQETVKEIFKLPPNIILPGCVDEKLISPEEFELLEKETNDLEKEYIKQIYRRDHLKKELEKLEHIQPLYEKIQEKLKFYKRNKPIVGEKSIEELYDVLKSCEEFYRSKQDKLKTDVFDEFGIFQTE